MIRLANYISHQCSVGRHSECRADEWGCVACECHGSAIALTDTCEAGQAAVGGAVNGASGPVDAVPPMTAQASETGPVSADSGSDSRQPHPLTNGSADAVHASADQVRPS